MLAAGGLRDRGDALLAEPRETDLCRADAAVLGGVEERVVVGKLAASQPGLAPDVDVGVVGGRADLFLGKHRVALDLIGKQRRVERLGRGLHLLG